MWPVGPPQRGPETPPQVTSLPSLGMEEGGHPGDLAKALAVVSPVGSRAMAPS